jgi:hypothetical protein
MGRPASKSYKPTKEGETMNMPGFTAEASLYKTQTLYQAAVQGVQANGTVHAAQIAIPFPGLPPSAVDPNPLRLYCWRCRYEPIPYFPYLERRCGIELC